MVGELDIAALDGHLDSVSLGGGRAGRMPQRCIS